MSTFEVKVRRIMVEPHPDPEAHSIELAKVDEYYSVIRKGQFQSGDLVVYIPEQAIVPDALIAELGLTGKLAGKEVNRVTAIRLRKQLSQGLCYRPDPWPEAWKEGTDVAEALGIGKWGPPIPQYLAGEVEPGPGGIFRTYTDIEDLRKFPQMFTEGEPVQMSEKLHGTNGLFGIVDDKRVVSSKGFSGRHLVLQESDLNVYRRTARQYQLHEKLEAFLQQQAGDVQNVLLFGEVLGCKT